MGKSAKLANTLVQARGKKKKKGLLIISANQNSHGVTSLEDKSPPVDVSISGMSVMRAFAFFRPFFFFTEEKFTTRSSSVVEGRSPSWFLITCDVPPAWSAALLGEEGV